MKSFVFFRILILMLMFIHVLPVFGSAYSPSTLPNPKTMDLNSWVADPDQILTTSETRLINQKLSDLSVKLQMGIVIVNEIASDLTPKQFATEVFNLWGVGQKKKDTGLLLVVVVGQRRWEFETGYGLEGDWPDIVVKRIGEENLVPAFRSKNWAQGLLKTIEVFSQPLKKDFRNYDISVSQNSTMWFGWALPFENTPFILLGILFFPTLIFYIYRKFRPQRFVWKRKTLLFYPKVGLIIFFLIGLTSYFALASTFDFVVVVKLMLIYFLAHTILLLVFFFIAFLQISKKRDVSERLDIALGFFSKYGLIFSGSIGFWGVPMVDRLIRKARFSDHECSHCHKIMTAKTDLITGKNENNFLDQQQRLEQTYEGLDYDVWKCTTCKNLSLYPIKLEKEGVEDCPKCQRRTFKYIRTQVLIAASVHQPGKGCNEFRCGSCQHQLKMTYEIPIISDSPSVSTRYHGFSGGTSGGSGTGWGGGRSGGGGAGGSW